MQNIERMREMSRFSCPVLILRQGVCRSPHYPSSTLANPSDDRGDGGFISASPRRFNRRLRNIATHLPRRSRLAVWRRHRQRVDAHGRVGTGVEDPRRGGRRSLDQLSGRRSAERAVAACPLQRDEDRQNPQDDHPRQHWGGGGHGDGSTDWSVHTSLSAPRSMLTLARRLQHDQGCSCTIYALPQAIRVSPASLIPSSELILHADSPSIEIRSASSVSSLLSPSLDSSHRRTTSSNSE